MPPHGIGKAAVTPFFREGTFAAMATGSSADVRVQTTWRIGLKNIGARGPIGVGGRRFRNF
jgi:hypothetical protein